MNFDTACGFDGQFLVGAGVDKTISYLQSQSDADSQAALEYIIKCQKYGDLDELASWADWRDRYFREAADSYLQGESQA